MKRIQTNRVISPDDLDAIVWKMCQRVWPDDISAMAWEEV